MPDSQAAASSADRLETQRQALQAQIDAQNEKLKDPASDAGDKALAQVTLQKLNDDMRQLLIAMKPAATASKTATGKDGSVWFVDETGNIKQLFPAGFANEVPNADEEIKKAVDRETAENERRRRQANEASTGIYGTDSEVATIKNQIATQNLNQDQLKQRITEFNQTQKLNEDKLAQQQKVDAANIEKTLADKGLTVAQTAGQEATTQHTQTTTDIMQRKAPGEIELTAAQTDAQKAAADASRSTTERNRQLIEQGNAPTIADVGTGLNIYQRDPKTGLMTATPNQNYIPKTQAEIAARIGQIQQLAAAKQQEVQGKVGQNGYTADNALKDFNQWWDAQVAPQQQALAAAADDAAFTRGKDLMTARTSAMTSALAAGTQGFNAASANSARSYLDANQNPNFGSITSTSAPDYAKLAKEGTMEALKYIDPTAAQATGMPAPNLGAINPAAMLDRTKYIPGAGAGAVAPAAPAPAAAAPAPAAAAPSGPTPDGTDFASTFARLNADKADQSRQARFPGVQSLTQGLYNPYYQQGSAVGQPATGPQGPVSTLGNTGAPWEIPGVMTADYRPARDGVPTMQPQPWQGQPGQPNQSILDMLTPAWLKNGTPPPDPATAWQQYAPPYAYGTNPNIASDRYGWA